MQGTTRLWAQHWAQPSRRPEQRAPWRAFDHGRALTGTSAAVTPGEQAPAERQGPVKRLLRWSFPRRFPIVQFPNAPLAVAILAAVAARFVHGHVHAYAISIEDLAMAAWAYVELAEGVNWFRRLLGLVVLVLTVMSVAQALHG